jgi:phosphohistidine phosphatase SixA
VCLLVSCAQPPRANSPTLAPAPSPAPTITLAPPPARPSPEVTPLATPGPAPQLAGQALLAALREGGYVIFLRHTQTDQSVGDSDDATLADCARQRNLNEAGRAQAQAIGAAIRALDIPIAGVLTSRYCRTLETARLLELGEPTIDDSLTGFNIAPDRLERKQRNEGLRALLSTPPPAGQNRLLVSHQYNLGDVTGLESVEGDALVFQPGGPAGFRLVARVGAEAWQELVEGARHEADLVERMCGLSDLSA